MQEHPAVKSKHVWQNQCRDGTKVSWRARLPRVCEWTSLLSAWWTELSVLNVVHWSNGHQVQEDSLYWESTLTLGRVIHSQTSSFKIGTMISAHTWEQYDQQTLHVFRISNIIQLRSVRELLLTRSHYTAKPLFGTRDTNWLCLLKPEGHLDTP